MIHKVLILFLALFFWLHSSILPVSASPDVPKLFEVNCAGCHPHGGNIIRRGKTLKQKALKRYNMDSQEAIMAIIAQGKNNMSAFGDRLTESEISAIASYVLEKAETNWR